MMEPTNGKKKVNLNTFIIHLFLLSKRWKLGQFLVRAPHSNYQFRICSDISLRTHWKEEKKKKGAILSIGLSGVFTAREFILL